MTRVHRILWGEGVFLRPQHFQQQERHLEERLARERGVHHAHPWGLSALEVDREALEEGGTLRLNRFSAVFQDGTPCEAPDQDPLPLSRDLQDIPGLEGGALVHACLPALNPFGGNVGDQGFQGGRPARYFPERIQAPDLLTDALESELTVLRTHVRLMVDGENRDGHESLPVARLQKHAGGGWRLDPGWIPPLREIRGSPHLLAMLRGLLAILQAKSASLAGSHREKARSVADFGTSDIASFWLLHTVNQAFPLLNHLLGFPTAHPERLHEALARLAGGLLTFSSTQSLQDIPPYRHQDLTATFQGLDGLVRGLLDTVISSRYAVVELASPRAGYYLGRLEGERIREASDFYLSVSADHPAAQIIEAVPLKLKVGSPDDVERIVNSALPGVLLSHATRTPSALPVRIGSHYFSLDPRGPIYERMIQSGTICIYAPMALPEMRLGLFAVFP